MENDEWPFDTQQHVITNMHVYFSTTVKLC